MRTILSEVENRHRRTVLLHTAVYMKGAIPIYESFGFAQCPRFRETPEHLKHTDYFMSKAI